MTDLSGRVVLVTGGNGGIGLAMARACGQAGAGVALWGRDEAKNAAAVEELTVALPGRAVQAYRCDVAQERDIVDTFAATVADLGRVDALFANAGRGGGRVPLVDLELDAWRAVLATNLDGVMLCFREAARHFVARGGGGSLVAVSSTSAVRGPARNHAYAASKTALLSVVRPCAVELARHAVRVNALLPGWTITDLARGGYEDDRFRSVTTQRTPVRRWAEPAEMGPAAAYLADPTVTFHTGDTLVVDGGYTIFGAAGFGAAGFGAAGVAAPRPGSPAANRYDRRRRSEPSRPGRAHGLASGGRLRPVRVERGMHGDRAGGVRGA